MTKNPLRPPSGCSTQWFRPEPYTLAELREWLPVEIPKPVTPTGIGRNEDLFRLCVKLAHQPSWAKIILHEGYAGRWLEHVKLLNIGSFAEHPLPDSECRSIAKSCANYSLRQFNEGIFSEIQAERGRRRAQQRWHPGEPDFDYRGRAETAALLFKLEYTVPEIATTFGVSDRTIQRDFAKIRKAQQRSK